MAGLNVACCRGAMVSSCSGQSATPSTRAACLSMCESHAHVLALWSLEIQFGWLRHGCVVLPLCRFCLSSLLAAPTPLHSLRAGSNAQVARQAPPVGAVRVESLGASCGDAGCGSTLWHWLAGSNTAGAARVCWLADMTDNGESAALLLQILLAFCQTAALQSGLLQVTCQEEELCGRQRWL